MVLYYTRTYCVQLQRKAKVHVQYSRDEIHALPARLDHRSRMGLAHRWSDRHMIHLLPYLWARIRERRNGPVDASYPGLTALAFGRWAP